MSNLVSNDKVIQPFVSANAVTSNSAEYYFKLAAKEYENGDFQKAKSLFVKAKELDMLRFRAPEAMNRIINTVTKKYPGIFLVDTKNIFEQHSPHQILGNSTLLEHVHPNLYGYALMSDAFYNALEFHNLPGKIKGQEISFSRLLQEMPVTTVDSLYGEYDVRQLKKNWPFSDTSSQHNKTPGSEEEKIAEMLLSKKMSWNDAMDQLMNYYLRISNYKAAQKVAEAVVLEYPYDLTLNVYAGKFCMEQKDYQKSIVYYQKAFAIHPSIEIAKNLYMGNLSIDRPDLAINFVDYAVKNQAGNPELLKLRRYLKELIELKKHLSDSSSPAINTQIADHYKLLGSMEMFAKYSGKIF
jgi:tetratricopeptide (TPR) repeat protein